MTAHDRPRRLTVADVMTTDVITVTETATFHEMSELMQRHRISALPVVDLAGCVIGVVSEVDLMPKEATPPTLHLWPRRSEFVEHLKAEGIVARDVMSAPVVRASASEKLAIAARRMLDHNVGRLPVVDVHGRLIGVASRRDVLRVFQRSDDDIRRDIVEGVMPHWLGIGRDTVDVSVAGGMVLLRGGVERRSEAETMGHLVAGLDGVVAVDNQLRWEFDDSHVAPPVEMHVR
ncbi:MAG: CBS domain-containing protein [Candidatus Dormibacteraeota bacterium]|nr:CBS domain-containing protein [Candidatus Dormibacteraeota bacterium]